MTDLAFYAAFHLAAHKGDTALLNRSSALKLHTAYPNNGNYAHGWIVVNRSWANGDALTHTGSNTQWYSNVWLAPARDFAVIAPRRQPDHDPQTPSEGVQMNPSLRSLRSLR